MTDQIGVNSLPELSLAEVLTHAGGPDPVPALLEPAGAVLVRDAGVAGAPALAALAGRLGLRAVDQTEPFAARRDLGDGVWSQPAWPATAPMCMHHELGWQREPPPYLLVSCLRAPATGGRTGVADGRAVLPLLPDALVRRAARHGWILVRRYAAGLIGMSWQEAFPDMDVAAVEAYAAGEGIDLSWGPDHLLTRRTRPALRRTGQDGVLAWSNLLAFCSEWTMDPAVRTYLITALGRAGLPFETSFGDGSPFTAADVEAVNAAYDRVSAHVTWRAGDVLVLDNIRAAHSSEPFTGSREMAVLHAAPAVPR
ncbi:Taurine catabolism dioxygenase TauD, TfdA family [Micromonospora sediminicola]|uniref:Taurine catabolism dioxygenase TauD, TfdA family n=1 Tax=Micromonospora sediminicola TaxID=946078 RepID=A0A1A9B9X6_9ACTN|nr:TauD/TfdA family dioxygenase [Micromonospora sediminicola]SBT65702.1 Taurine catabolism dioxygenase TauD, TfdA family [Micromonospora sediminicola]